MELTNDEEKIIQAYRNGADIEIYFLNFDDDQTKDHAKQQFESLGLSIDRVFRLKSGRYCIRNESAVERININTYYEEQNQEGNTNDNSHESN